MLLAPAIEIVVGIAHSLRRGAAQHDLEVNGLEAIVDIAVDHAGRAGDALPLSEPRLDALPGLVLEEDGEEPIEHEEYLLDLMGVRGVSLTGRHEHDAQREAARRDHRGIVMLARAAAADEAVLGALVALVLRILEGVPIGFAVAEPSDVAPYAHVDRTALQLRP